VRTRQVGLVLETLDENFHADVATLAAERTAQSPKSVVVEQYVGHTHVSATDAYHH